jgi:hypothetical protein
MAEALMEQTMKMGGIENTLNQMMGLLSDAIGQNKSKRSKED